MAIVDSEHFRSFQKMVADTGGTYAFDGETAVQGIGLLLKTIRDMGLNPMVTADLRAGMFSLFNVELVDMPDFASGRFILAPNHVSDADALILGLLHPGIRIVSKDDWTNNEKLRQFLDIHYDVYGLQRANVQSLRRLLTDSIRYFNDSDENRHYLVFSQGTISDFNSNSPARISTIAQKVSERTDVAIVNMFVEQVSLTEPTRIVFDRPMRLSRRDDFSTIWLEREAAMQNALVPAARRPCLTRKHANNNRPGDLFF